jgi:hypothetical protein
LKRSSFSTTFANSMSKSIPPLGDVMAQLAKKRPIFHSEADFQHAFAWELHRRLPDSDVSLERPYRAKAATLHLDMLVQSEGQSLAIELKYKTRKFEHSTSDQSYHLSNQSAQDIGRYDFIKDIWRLEEITRSIPQCVGWAIMLTNDSTYWGNSKRADTVDAFFRLSEGLTIHGTRDWGERASAGTKKNRETPLVLTNSYQLRWADYSTPSTRPNGTFRFLAVEVKNIS